MSSVAWSTRVAGPDDADALTRLHVACLRETYQPLYGQDFADSLLSGESVADIAAEDREFLSDPTSRVVLGLDGTGEPAGFASVCDGPQRWELQFEPGLQPERELVKLYVLERLHGSGLGRQLLDEAVEGHDPVYLWIMAGNARAEAFYAKNGFERIGPSYQADGPWAGQETFRMRRS